MHEPPPFQIPQWQLWPGDQPLDPQIAQLYDILAERTIGEQMASEHPPLHGFIQVGDTPGLVMPDYGAEVRRQAEQHAAWLAAQAAAAPPRPDVEQPRPAGRPLVRPAGSTSGSESGGRGTTSPNRRSPGDWTAPDIHTAPQRRSDDASSRRSSPSAGRSIWSLLIVGIDVALIVVALGALLLFGSRVLRSGGQTQDVAAAGGIMSRDRVDAVADQYMDYLVPSSARIRGQVEGRFRKRPYFDDKRLHVLVLEDCRSTPRPNVARDPRAGHLGDGCVASTVLVPKHVWRKTQVGSMYASHARRRR